MAASLFRRTVSRSALRSVAALAAVVALASGCKSDPMSVSIIDTQFGTSLGVDLDASTRTASGLYYRDIVVGTGAVATQGSAARVHYTLYETSGRQREAGQFDLTLGSGGAIRGFDEGVTGMRVGGRRQLIVPPHLAYNDGVILVFTVELLSVS